MAFITMWQHGARKCVLIVGGAQKRLCLLEGMAITREQIVGGDAAVVLSELWEAADDQAERHGPAGLGVS